MRGRGGDGKYLWTAVPDLPPLHWSYTPVMNQFYHLDVPSMHLSPPLSVAYDDCDGYDDWDDWDDRRSLFLLLGFWVIFDQRMMISR